MFTEFRITVLEQGWLARLVESDQRKDCDLSTAENAFINWLYSMCAPLSAAIALEGEGINKLAEPHRLELANVAGQA